MPRGTEVDLGSGDIELDGEHGDPAPPTPIGTQPPVFSASRVHHVSDLHLKFTLRPHHVWKYGRHPICDG